LKFSGAKPLLRLYEVDRDNFAFTIAVLLPWFLLSVFAGHTEYLLPTFMSSLLQFHSAVP
jgi:hypothetical protein